MAKAKKKKAAKRKAGGLGPLRSAGSPITIGGGSILIEFQNEANYPNHPTYGDHVAAATTQIESLKITDAKGKILDLSSFLPAKREDCQVTIYTKSGDPKEVITVQGKPLGIRFDEGIYRLGGYPPKPAAYYAEYAVISRIEFSYPGNLVKFEDPTVNRYTVRVDSAV